MRYLKLYHIIVFLCLIIQDIGSQVLTWAPDFNEITEDTDIHPDSMNKRSALGREGPGFCLCRYDHLWFSGFMHGIYKGGRMQGKWIHYFNHKIVREVNLKDGKREGRVIDYDQKGELLRCLSFVNDSLNGEANFFSGGKEVAILHFEGDNYQVKHCEIDQEQLAIKELLLLNQKVDCPCRWKW